MRTIEEQVAWIDEFSSFQEICESLGNWIEFDPKKLYVHLALGCLGPEGFERSLAEGHCPGRGISCTHLSSKKCLDNRGSLQQGGLNEEIGRGERVIRIFADRESVIRLLDA